MFDRSIIDELMKSKGYEMALMTTFNFEISFFERCILNVLYDNNIKKVNLFVDSNEFNKALKESENNFVGKKYVINPYEMNSSFHPKVILLLAPDRAKLIVSSANIKTSGYKLNNEIYNVFEYSKDKQENLKLINDAITFFYNLNEKSFYKDETIFEKIDKEFIYYHREAQNTDTYLIHNFEESVLEQLSKIVTGSINQINIAVPFYDNELLALKEIKNAFPNAKISLYIQNEKSTFPVEYNELNNVVAFESIKPYEILKNNKSKNFYHGKAFQLKNDKESYILYGSSNCTLSALTKSYKNGGNIECNILEKGSKDEFDYFFDNFDVNYNMKLTNKLLDYNQEPKVNFVYKYGELKSSLELCINYKDEFDNLKITINEIELTEYFYENGFLRISIPAKILDNISNVFDLTIQYNSNTEILRCWYLDKDSLENYRQENKEFSFNDIQIDEDMNKYKEHIELIIRTIALSKDEYNEQMRLNNLFNANKTNSETEDELDEDELDETFIIDKDIPDEYVKKHRDFTNAYIKSKIFATRFFKGIMIPSGKKTNNTLDNNEINESKKVQRKATTAEKRFERFLKSRIKGMLSDEYVNLVEYEHYKNSIGVVLDTIDEFKYNENIEDIFEDSYVINTKLSLLKKLISKNNKEITKEEQETTIVLVIMTLIENHYLNNASDTKSYRIELENKEVMKLLNNLYDVRECIDDYTDCAIATILNKNLIPCDIDFVITKKYVEDLFGYKTPTQLLELLKNYYGFDSKISYTNEKLNITVNTSEPMKYMKENINILKEVKKHFQNDNNLMVMIIEIINSNINENFPNPLTKFTYEINIKTGHIVRTYYRKYGSPEIKNDIIRII